MDPDKHKEEKAGLVVASVLAGFIVFLIMLFAVGAAFMPLAAVVGIGASFGYVFLAADAAEVFVSIRSWAYCGKVERPPDNQILVIGALWPFMIFGGGLIYTFIGIINRKF